MSLNHRMRIKTSWKYFLEKMICVCLQRSCGRLHLLHYKTTLVFDLVDTACFSNCVRFNGVNSKVLIY